MEERVLKSTIQKITRLSEKELDAFLALSEEKVIKKKTVLVKPGQSVEKAYFVKKGCIRHYFESNKKQFTKNLLQGPRFFLPSLTAFFFTNAVNYFL